MQKKQVPKDTVQETPGMRDYTDSIRTHVIRDTQNPVNSAQTPKRALKPECYCTIYNFQFKK